MLSSLKSPTPSLDLRAGPRWTLESRACRTALQGVALPEGLLEDVELTVLGGQALNGTHLGAVELRDERQTRAGRVTVECTVQQPHTPCSHPTCVPVSWSSWRRKSLSNSRGSTEASTSLPFTVRARRRCSSSRFESSSLASFGSGGCCTHGAAHETGQEVPAVGPGRRHVVFGGDVVAGRLLRPGDVVSADSSATRAFSASVRRTGRDAMPHPLIAALSHVPLLNPRTTQTPA